MPYDPNFPVEHTEILAEQFRNQFHGIKDLIDAAPAGPPGPQGVPGATGSNGSDGMSGPQGVPGPQGPPFANALVDAVNTLNPGDAATVTVTFDGTNVHFTIAIPRGNNGPAGATGPQGGDGPQGPQGPQGIPGEVTAQQLADAITAALATAASTAAANSSANTNAVPTLDTPFANDPPTLADFETLRAAYNTLVTSMRR